MNAFWAVVRGIEWGAGFVCLVFAAAGSYEHAIANGVLAIYLRYARYSHLKAAQTAEGGKSDE